MSDFASKISEIGWDTLKTFAAAVAMPLGSLVVAEYMKKDSIMKIHAQQKSDQQPASTASNPVTPQVEERIKTIAARRRRGVKMLFVILIAAPYVGTVVIGKSTAPLTRSDAWLMGALFLLCAVFVSIFVTWMQNAQYVGIRKEILHQDGTVEKRLYGADTNDIWEREAKRDEK